MQAAGLSKIEEICSHSQAGRCLPNGVPALVEGNNHADDSEFEKSAVPCALLHPMHRQVSSCLLKNMVTYPPLNSYISETASSPVCTGDTQPQHPAGMQWQELASSRPRSMLFKMLSGFRGQSNHKVSKSPGPHHTAPHRTAPHNTTPQLLGNPVAVEHALKRSLVALGEAQRQQSLREIKRRSLRRSQETRNLRRTPEQWKEVQWRSRGPPRDIAEIPLDSKALLNPRETVSALYVSRQRL